MFQYVSNAGIIFRIGELQVGIDCLCRDSSQLYQDTPQEIREQLNPDILIFTHEHEDHFCAKYVKEAWEKNPNLQIYSTKKVVECLAEYHIPNDNLNEAEDGESLEINDVCITFMDTIHEGDQYANVQNLALLIKKGDKSLVVSGDAMPCKELFEKINAWSSKIDWLLVPFPYVGLRSTRKLICEHLSIKNIFVLHQPRPEADRQNWVTNTKLVCDRAKDGLPYPIFPEEFGKWNCT